MTDIVFEKIIVGCAYYTMLIRQAGLNHAQQCVEKQGKCVKYISLIKYSGAQKWLLSPEDNAVVKEYEIITLKYNGKECRLDLLFICASEDIIL